MKRMLLCFAFAVIIGIGNVAVMDTGGLSRESFPMGFVFGTSTSAYQVEGMANKGGRGPSIWDVYVKQPEGVGKVNWAGVAYYNRMINYLVKKGITPYGNLYHSDLPLALQEKYNGFLNHQFVEDYVDYAEFCFKTFGDRVKNWFTFNEPRIVAALGFDNGVIPPLRCSKEVGNCNTGNSAIEPYIVGHNLILSHAKAVKKYREKYQAKQKGRIGILLDFNWYEPLTRSKADNYAAQRARDFHVGWFLHPIRYDEYPKTMQEIIGERLPKFTEEEVKMVNGSFDYVGINQYTTRYISSPKTPSNVTSYQTDWNATFASMDDPGNATLPNGLKDTIRIKFFKDYMTQLKKAIDEGANVTGYFAWSLLDNFEWLLGYTSRFGIIYVDYSNLQRYPKMSAFWFKQLLEKK
ncbi:beta-glucosidase 44 isoform X2 [Gossypium raimondii]|uniref:beta-glucosidase 44 isoform X2 n=1 Tax=Gossypium raimondii TaxID=29730 RepID=UPI00227A3063|nr:beta-glucosidase 44 isoform X2 [Gossypium raimondii]